MRTELPVEIELVYFLPGMKSHLDLEIYQIAFDLAIVTHRHTLKLPKYENYELGSQLRRASKSIVFNIVEGYGRRI